MANSSPVSPGDDILASDYNDLRDDVLDSTTGHPHDGVDGKVITASGLAADSVETAKIKAANVTNAKIKTGTGSIINLSASAEITMQDYCFFPNVHADSAGLAEMDSFLANPTDDYVARFRFAWTSGIHDIYYRYITSSGPPEIWIVRDKSKGIFTIWECDDPAPEGKPPIICRDKDGNKIGKTYRIIPPDNFAELKAQCQKDMAEKKPGAKHIGKVLLAEWEIDEDSNPERPVGLDPARLVKKLKKIGS